MKTRVLLYFSALLALASCGSAARYATDTSGQRYQDGIYYTSDASATEMAAGREDKELPDLHEEWREGRHPVHPKQQGGENRFQQE